MKRQILGAPLGVLVCGLVFSSSLFADRGRMEHVRVDGLRVAEQALHNIVRAADNTQGMAWDQVFRVHLINPSQDAEYQALARQIAQQSHAKHEVKPYKPFLLIVANDRLHQALNLAQTANHETQKTSVHDTLSLSLAYATNQDLRKKRGKLPHPVEGEIKTKFGTEPLKGTAAHVRHTGIAFDVPIGTEVKSIGKGLVVFAREFDGLGNLVIIDHGAKFYSLYGHLSRIDVTQGEEVRVENRIGLSGAEKENGPELYFEIRINGEPVDPEPFLIY